MGMFTAKRLGLPAAVLRMEDAEGISSGRVTDMGTSSSVIYLPLVTKFGYRSAPVEADEVVDSGSTTPSRGPQRASPNDRDVLVIEVSLLRDRFCLWCMLLN